MCVQTTECKTSRYTWKDKLTCRCTGYVHILASSDFRSVICGDMEEMWADVFRYHDHALMIDEDCNQQALLVGLFRSVPDKG